MIREPSHHEGQSWNETHNKWHEGWVHEYNDHENTHLHQELRMKEKEGYNSSEHHVTQAKQMSHNERRTGGIFVIIADENCSSACEKTRGEDEEM
mmetsp:Transcript_4920/g.18511  ORF Transcript_4920/g.18511 Transcript_4920/m.18511 type:complete len:95 (+) Transcript_4920:860-1144(+)